MCGILGGGVILIGSLLGRVSPEISDGQAQRLAGTWRRRFAEAMGATKCADLRAALPNEPHRCLPLVRRGISLLLDVLGDYVKEGPYTPR